MNTHDQDKLDELSGDQQILEEIVTNEKIVYHKKFGDVRLLMPTLDLQKHIDRAVRTRRKELRRATDTVEAEDGTTEKIPAYKSREALAREYRELGWWTDSEDLKMQELTANVVNKLTELELLGFVDEDTIYENMADLRVQLEEEFAEHESFEKVWAAVQKMTSVTASYDHETETFLRREALSSTVDDLLDKVLIERRTYDAFVEILGVQTQLLQLQAEYMNLFSESWQEQLQYFTRLAQVFFCARKADDGSSLWPSIDAIEKEQDVDLVRWVFGELDAFWKGFSDEVRDKMEKYNFIYGRSDQNQSSDDLPVPPESSEDGAVVENTQEISSEVTDTAGQ